MAAAWLSSMISSMFLISRASSITCWPSTTFMPAFCNSKNIAVSAISTPTGMSATPAARNRLMTSSACAFISPTDGGTVPRMPSMPARQLSGTSQSQLMR